MTRPGGRYTRAAKAFEDFSGHQPTKVTRYPLDSRDVVGWKLGPAVGIAYEAKRDGKKSRYFHEFAPGAAPDLVASEDGRKLYLVDGKYEVGARGIEDMPDVFVVNPSDRRGAAKRKPMAGTPKRNSKGRFVKRGAARRAPAKRRRSGARQVAVFTAAANPAPRKRRASPSRRRAATTTKRRYRRNPSARGMLAGLGKMIIPAAGVGAGAVLAELFMGSLPIPADFKSGMARHLTKGAVGLGLGWVAAKVFRQKKLGLYIGAGTIVIVVHDLLKEALARRITGIQFGGMSQYVVPPLATQFPQRSGGQLGYITPGMPAGFNGYGQYITGFGAASQAYDGAGGETAYSF